MMTTKVSFTLDQVAMEKLQDAATRLALPKSEIVRKAILEFHDRLGRLTETERFVMLRAFDELVPKRFLLVARLRLIVNWRQCAKRGDQADVGPLVDTCGAALLNCTVIVHFNYAGDFR
jgi:hypothetical protein